MKTDKYTDRDWENIAAYFSGENGNMTEGNIPELDDTVLKAGEAWKSLSPKPVSDKIDLEKGWQKVKARIDTESGTNTAKTFTLRPLLKIAAAVLILASVGSALFLLNNDRKSNYITFETGNSRNVEVTLPDGSRVWLNRNTEISYPSTFSATERKVLLKGEAFFDVVRDENKPFIIDAGTGTVKVLGTSFNVISSNERNQLEVLVETGRVIVTDSENKETVTLAPGFIGRVGGEKTEALLNADRNYIAWKTDLLVYNGEKLGTVLSDLKKVHNIDIVTTDREILEKSYFGVFDKLPQDTVLKIICTTFNLSYKKEGEKYTLER